MPRMRKASSLSLKILSELWKSDPRPKTEIRALPLRGHLHVDFRSFLMRSLDKG
jgi:hypothetical protein